MDVHHTALMEIADDILAPPPSDSIAFFVKMQRHHWRWKQPVLAAMAGVSLSTVQRVERGESVSTDNLSKIAVALGFPADYLTTPRRKLSEQEAMQRLADSVAWMEGMVEVPLTQLTMERQLRELASTDMIVLGSDLDDDAAGDLDELREWLPARIEQGIERLGERGISGEGLTRHIVETSVIDLRWQFDTIDLQQPAHLVLEIDAAAKQRLARG